MGEMSRRLAVAAWLGVAGLTVGATPAAAQDQGGTGAGLATAIFAGGCFWCVEAAFDKIEGVRETVSGYTGGRVADPSYQQVSAGTTGHTEALRIRYDPTVVDYRTLLDVFWINIDPFDGGGQFCDRGSQYRSEVFAVDAEQKTLAIDSKARLEARFSREIATGISDAVAFYPAEDYHQNYHQENPFRYRFYTWGCGRAQRLEQVWGTDPHGPFVGG